MTISVGIMGFSRYEENKIKKIFELSKLGNDLYQLANIADTEAVDWLMVKEGDDVVLGQQHAYQAKYKDKVIQVIKTGREPANQEVDYIRGVLVPSRIFAAFETIQARPKMTRNTEGVVDRANNLIAGSAQANEDSIPEDVLQVLVVDDSVMMQKTVQMELKKSRIPLAIDFADDGEMALEKAKLKKYDVIFLDVMMPGIDGFETCTQIRKFDGMAKTPIIMLTSKTSAMDEVKGLMAGCTTYLTKPFDHDEFQKMLERIMQWVKEFNERK